MEFTDLGLIPQLLRAVRVEEYTTPTPIQRQAIPHLLQGRDLLGCAQTGTGKTAAFALPILQRLTNTPRAANGQRPIRVLVLAPTRELVAQIAQSFKAYGRFLPHATASIFGGVSQVPQVNALRKGTDIVVATPGRLLDLMEQGHVRLDHVEVLVLDEADRMLDMGFIVPIRHIVRSMPKQRQTLLFSATMPREIMALAQSLLTSPVNVAVTPVSSAATRIDQRVAYVDKGEKLNLLLDLLKRAAVSRTLIFTRTKHGADKLAQHLQRAAIRVEALHGNKTQGARERALDNFRAGRSPVLVATDIAARGIDVEGISHVVNFDVPVEAEAYVHRIGRTARAGAEGTAITLCSIEERLDMRSIEKLIGQRVPVLEGTVEPMEMRQPARSLQPTRPGFRPGRRSFGPRGRR
ncbi:MAG: DEAD/DEAH box helicase [SAR202 cluster bacterium]|nr:DEAD/DEAH box helicase [SAR202 cluster bacterium]